MTAVAQEEKKGATKPNEAPSESLLGICDLPDEALTSISNYLPHPSAAILFAVALTAPSASWRRIHHSQQKPSAMCNAIVSAQDHQWDELNFFDIDEILAGKLTDDDLHAILECIDGANKLKKLKLTGCFSITGRGLEPLRYSIVLEQIDLSIDKLIKSSDKLDMDYEAPLVSETATIPILECIIDNDGNSLRQLQIPQEWGNERSQIVDDFLTRYSCQLNSRPFNCSGCEDRARFDSDDECWEPEEADWFAGSMFVPGEGGYHQKFTCYSCLNNCCDHDMNDENNNCRCMKCDRNYCGSCKLKQCWNCEHKTCEECIVECEGCRYDHCDSCCRTCDFCKQTRCDDCANPFKSMLDTYIYDFRGCKRRNPNSPYTHEKCSCFNCSLPYYRHALYEGQHICSGCAIKNVPELAKEIERMGPEIEKGVGRLRQRIDEIESLQQN